MMNIILQGLFAIGATAGFSIIFHVPAKTIPVCSIVGGLGWALYEFIIGYDSTNAMVASFFAAALVGLLSEICARVFKEAATLFTIPGIMPLVPGIYIFRSMEAMLNGNTSTTTYGIDCLKIAAAIAFGLLAVGAVFKILHAMHAKTIEVTNDVIEAIKRPSK